METNVRYGVINDVNRIAYEKKWQVPAGYDYITYDQTEAIVFCRKKGSSAVSGWVVEKIFNLPNKVVNFKTIIFKGGDYSVNDSSSSYFNR